MHIFFDCPYARRVWELVPLRHEIPTTVEDTMTSMIVKFRDATCLLPAGVLNTILPWVLWSLWLARNKLHFEGKTTRPEEVATKSISYAREWNQAQKSGTSPTKPTAALSTRIGRRSAPGRHIDASMITCTTDASWNATSRTAGLAWILWGHNGEKTNQESEIQQYVSSPLMVEALAIRSAIAMAAALEIPNLQICSDSQTLIRAINNKMQDKEIYGILNDIHQISSVFGSISFSFLPRQQNKEADELAKRTLQFASFQFCYGPNGPNI